MAAVIDLKDLIHCEEPKTDAHGFSRFGENWQVTITFSSRTGAQEFKEAVDEFQKPRAQQAAEYAAKHSLSESASS